MARPLIAFIGIGLVAVGLLIGFSFWWTRGAHMELNGRILKVRIHPADENSSIAILDFRFTNPADYQFVVRTVRVLLRDKDGSEVQGDVISDLDIRRVFQYFPGLGQKYNDTLLAREKIAPKQTLDRMISARFHLPESALGDRQAFLIRVEEVDGVVTEIAEQKP